MTDTPDATWKQSGYLIYLTIFQGFFAALFNHVILYFRAEGALRHIVTIGQENTYAIHKGSIHCTFMG